MPFLATPYANENISEETAKRIAALQVKLDQKLGPEYISQRQGPRGGPKLTYAEGWKIINLANEVFGFNGWSSNLVNLTTDFVDRSESGRYNVGVTAVVRVTLREGVYHEDLGYGTAENCPNKGQALDKCKKEAVTDGLKRALRNFGNLMGNCLYDKAYTQEVVKIKVPAAKFDKSELHRRPEFAEDTKPQINLNASKPPVPPFNPNASTSSSMSTSASASRQPASEGSAQASRNSAPVADESGQNIIAKEEPENSFDFSDDDVFLAALEGLGRPIETDADMGQPIDQGESYLPPEGDTHTPVNDTSTADISMNAAHPYRANTEYLFVIIDTCAPERFEINWVPN
ncbi:DNA repair and recombination protein rhm52 [Leucoagaricus sp. SymC.cos]|nr:DNA repair and recombination protein rhm52 [Leucoagaricus sp. SymC.cos]